MSLGSITERAPGTGPSTVKWVGGTIVALLLWGLVYSQLIPFSEWVVSLVPIDPKSHLGEAISFFVYDTPKVLMLLTLVVFGMGVVRSFFSPEKTRALLAGKREGAGNVLAASSGYSPHSARALRCRCSSASSAPVFPLASPSRS